VAVVDPAGGRARVYRARAALPIWRAAGPDTAAGWTAGSVAQVLSAVVGAIGLHLIESARATVVKATGAGRLCVDRRRRGGEKTRHDERYQAPRVATIPIVRLPADPPHSAVRLAPRTASANE